MTIHIHHIAAISTNWQRTLRFYHHVLGLRVHHKASLFDGPKVCHFYLNEGVKGFITFYHCPGLADGRNTNSSDAISFSVPISSFHYWVSRFQKEKISFFEQQDPFDKRQVLLFKDPDGLSLKLHFLETENRSRTMDSVLPWRFAVQGISGLKISTSDFKNLAAFFTCQLGLTKRNITGNCNRFHLGPTLENILDVYDCPGQIADPSGCGRLHHIAFEVTNWLSYSAAQSFLFDAAGWSVFRRHPDQYSSLYFKLGEGPLFEILGERPLWEEGKKKIVSGNRGKNNKKKAEKEVMIGHSLATIFSCY
ncbi:MAG TPA: VOC family protein [Flavisolibacter sp.]|jgi:catechol 2,3-dioxygenase-like lactoylglutathione lyase family enzyme